MSPTSDRNPSRSRRGSGASRAGGRSRPEAQLRAISELLGGELLSGEPAQSLPRLSEAAARLLEVERAGVWALSGDGRVLRCVDQFARSADQHATGAELAVDEHPAYLKALRESDAVRAGDVRRKVALQSLRAALRASGTGAELDVPIRSAGRLIGVLCLGHQGGPRRWSDGEVRLASLLAASAGLLLQQLERQRAARVSCESEEQLRLAIESTEDGVWDWDLEKGEMRCSDRMATMLGYEPGELRQSAASFSAMLHPDDAAETSRRFEEHVAGTASSYQHVLRMRHKGGHYVWLRSRGKIVARDASGRPLRVIGTNVDVSEQKRVEEELRRKNSLLDAIREVQDRLILTTDMNAAFERMLDAVLRLTQSEYGFISEVVIGQDGEPHLKTQAITNIAWDEATRAFYSQHASSGLVFANLKTLFGAVLTSGQPVLTNQPDDDPRSGSQPSGHPALRSFLGLPFFDQGRLVGMVGVANRAAGYTLQMAAELAPFLATCATLTAALRDRQRSRAALHELDRFFETAVDPLCVLDAAGTIGRANPAFANRLGYATAQVRDRPLLDFIHGEDHAATRGAFSALRGGAESVGFETRCLCRDGSVRWLSWSAAASDSGDVYASARDITEMRQAEEERRRLVALVENSADCICLAALDGRINYANTAAQSLLGISLSPTQPLHLSELAEPEERARSESDWQELMRNGWSSGPRRFRNRQTGNLLFVEVMYFYTHDERGQPEAVACVVRDVTERQRLTEQLIQAQKMEAVGRLAGGIAHDFNNILTAIQGCASLLQESLYRHPDADLTREILAASERAAALTRQLLALSRKQLLSPMPVDLGSVLTSLRGMLQQLVGRPIRVRIDVEPGLVQVRLDPNRIEQVIVNLAVHARDAMPDGGELRIAARNVTIAAPATGEPGPAASPLAPVEHVELTFTDTGRGLSDELRSHLFEPFFTRGGPGRGSGLELATVYGIVTQSGGHISVESAPDSGTTFRLLFPISTAVPAPTTLLSSPVEGGHERVLIVEDDKEVREMLSFSMRAVGYEIFEAVDGLDAIELLDRTGLQPDLLVTDVVMPNLGGHELARHMQQRQPRLRVLYMTGYTDDPALHLGLNQGSFSVLSKPFRPEQLARAVRALLDAPESPPS